MFVIIPYSKIRAYAKRIERQNLKKRGRSISWVSMLNLAPKMCELYSPENTAKVESTWKMEFEQFKEALK